MLQDRRWQTFKAHTIFTTREFVQRHDFVNRRIVTRQRRRGGRPLDELTNRLVAKMRMGADATSCCNAGKTWL